jgi:hypothetical protein
VHKHSRIPDRIQIFSPQLLSTRRLVDCFCLSETDFVWSFTQVNGTAAFSDARLCFESIPAFAAVPILTDIHSGLKRTNQLSQIRECPWDSDHSFRIYNSGLMLKAKASFVCTF